MLQNTYSTFRAHSNPAMTDQRPEPLLMTSFPLFVPGDRSDRIAKACKLGTDTVIIDLEDGVAPARKVAARAALFDALPSEAEPQLVLRINPHNSSWHDDDLVLATHPGLSGIMLPKSETAEQVGALRRRLRPDQHVIALIETALGLQNIDDLAGKADRLAFGSIDFAVDLGCSETRHALLFARSRLVLASRLAGLPAPLDGVTTNVKNLSSVEEDAAYARDLGFGGKLLIHPNQLVAARKGFKPTAESIAWAQRINAAGSNGAVAVDGEMVDAPVLARARRILTLAEQLS